MFRPCLALVCFLALSSCTTAPPTASSGTVALRILAINDFHGNLEPPAGGMPDPAAPTRTIAAGGAPALASLVKQERADHPNTILVGAGDLIGASPLLSGLFHDEPSVEALSRMGMAISAVGNHEFDKGIGELRRMQNGGCSPVDGCRGPAPFSGAAWRYLAANVVDTASGKTVFPSYVIKSTGGVPVAFVGVVLKSTPDIVVPSGVAGLRFGDEVQSVNALVPSLHAQGVNTIILLIHEGGTLANPADYNGCTGLSGRIAQIVPQLDKAVGVIISGHTHQAYNCTIDGRLVTSAYRYGMMLTRIDLTLDRQSHAMIAAHADNLIVRDDALEPDAEQARLIAAWHALAAPVAGRVAGHLTAPLSRDATAAGESTLGDIIADAELAAAHGGADIAFMNPGGIRNSLSPRPDGSVSHADLFAVQPFSNLLLTLTLTGDQIKALLEQQWQGQPMPRILQISQGFSYNWDASRPEGQRVLNILLNGAPLRPNASYRVVVPDFLADGGDRMTVLKQGADRHPLIGDIAAVENYLAAHNPLAPPVLARIRRQN